MRPREVHRVGRLSPGLSGALALGCILAALALGCSEEEPNYWPMWGEYPEEPGPSGADFFPAWSPDGRTVAYYTNFRTDPEDLRGEQYLRLIDVETREITTVTELPPVAPFALSWDPESRWLVMSTSPGIFKILRTGDSLTELISGQYLLTTSWSGISDRIFFWNNGGSERGVYSMNPDGSGLIRWTYPDSFYVERPFLFPDTDTLTVAAVDEQSTYCLALYYPGDRTVTRELRCRMSWVGDIKMSADHRHVAFIGKTDDPTRTSLYLYDRVQDSISLLTAARTDCFDFSPDGRHIVYWDHIGTGGLQIIELDSHEITELTPGYR